MKQRVIGVLRVQMSGVGVTRYGGESLNVSQRQRAQQAGTLAQGDFVKSDVFNQISVQRKIHNASSIYGKTLGPEQSRHYFLTRITKFAYARSRKPRNACSGANSALRLLLSATTASITFLLLQMAPCNQPICLSDSSTEWSRA